MKLYKYPPSISWPLILERPSIPLDDLEPKVRKVMKRVRKKGDKALRKYTEAFDGVVLKDFLVTQEETDAATAMLSDELKTAINIARQNIETFHLSQVGSPESVETMPGVVCWRKAVGIEKVGLYIPGGTAPLFSTILMLGIPAAIAGCREVVLCSPPSKDGKLNPAILYTAALVGIRKVYKLGGVQAIAAMTYGTESVPKVSKIFGPGNQYV
ncbi:MAG: histidinol dehydrogenase, partial [Chitinophagaceae bacterium]